MNILGFTGMQSVSLDNSTPCEQIGMTVFQLNFIDKNQQAGKDFDYSLLTPD